MAPEHLWLSNRSETADALADYQGVNVTSSIRELADRCDVILLAVPPASASGIGVDASGKLVLSFMAGISLAELVRITGAYRAIRAMSSPAAQASLAYSPWCANADVTDDDRALVSVIFSACGRADEVESATQIECFTAMTGPVPGFVAFNAKAMVDYAVNQRIPPEVTDRAIRQLFLGTETMMSDGEMTLAGHVKQMIDYAGTTAAGLEAMNHSSITAEIADALDIVVAKTWVIG